MSDNIEYLEFITCYIHLDIFSKQNLMKNIVKYFYQGFIKDPQHKSS